MVHRDLKPDNILVAPDGYLCLADFGYAKKEEERTDWMMLGTAFYMAPEILEQGAYTGKAIDWWAAGCILFQMLAGKPVSLLCRPIRRFPINDICFFGSHSIARPK